jgi:UDP-N-acetylmuramoyl-tripeptide--D-alanyl-D-alanine ligase
MEKPQLNVEEDTEIVVLEMGMSNAGEMKVLSEIAKPDFMIGVSHLSSLGSREGIALAKLELLEGLNPSGAIIIKGDEPLIKTDVHYSGASVLINFH